MGVFPCLLGTASDLGSGHIDISLLLWPPAEVWDSFRVSFISLLIGSKTDCKLRFKLDKCLLLNLLYTDILYQFIKNAISEDVVSWYFSQLGTLKHFTVKVYLNILSEPSKS